MAFRSHVIRTRFDVESTALFYSVCFQHYVLFKVLQRT